MPRRYADYGLQFADWNMVSSIGAFMYGGAQILFLYNVIRTIGWGKPTSDAKVWEGAEGLEWTVPPQHPITRSLHHQKLSKDLKHGSFGYKPSAIGKVKRSSGCHVYVCNICSAATL